LSLLETNFRPVVAPSALDIPSCSRMVPAWYAPAKRTIDVTVAAAGLLTTAPILAAAMVAIMVVTGDGPLFRQERVGAGGQRFMMWKLRTMVRNAHAQRQQICHLNEVDGPVFKVRRDPRLHRLGRFLRRTSIDELPNFVNVLLGDMSIVGPRPPLPEEVASYDRRAMRRLSVKPGVTCLWQISGRSELTFDQWMDLDATYIEAWNPLTDLLIIARTIPAVIRGVGAH
jgi:lipopolysaccharide/colanic/teichoic acid biosynthesis glycosyltransferase